MERVKDTPTDDDNDDFQDKVSVRHPSQLELRDTEGKTFLILAGVGKIEALTYLLDVGANVNAQDFNGLTALMIAVKCGNIDCVNLLLEKGEAKSHYQDNFGSTALHLAIQFGCNMDIIRTLVSNWANSNIKNFVGQKPVDIVPSHEGDVKEYLLSSPTERAGCLFKALSKEFEDLTSKAEEMLVEVANSSSSPRIRVIQSPSKHRNDRVKCCGSIYITGQGSDSDIAIQTSLSELIRRYTVLRIALQHQISELATDYGDANFSDDKVYLRSNSQCSITDKSIGKYSDSMVSKRIAFQNIPNEKMVMAEIQWCLEALSEVCRIFANIFPHAKSLLEINRWSLLQEGKDGNTKTNWITLPLKITKIEESTRKKNGWGANFLKGCIVKSIIPLRKSSSVLVEIAPILSKPLLLHKKYSIQPEDDIHPKLSIQNILFSQVPELYEQHLTKLSNKSIDSISNIETRCCMIS
jgi:hypothetical protein